MAFALGPGMILVALVSLGANEKRPVERAIVGAGTLIYPGLLAGLIAALRAGPDGFAWLFLVYATVEIADAFALLFGKLIERPPVEPPRDIREGESLMIGVPLVVDRLLHHLANQTISSQDAGKMDEGQRCVGRVWCFDDTVLHRGVVALVSLGLCWSPAVVGQIGAAKLGALPRLDVSAVEPQRYRLVDTGGVSIVIFGV